LSPASFTESVVEQAVLAWLESLGWEFVSGSAIAPGEPAAERETWAEVVLKTRLHDALARLNPRLSAEALHDALGRVLRSEQPDLVAENRAFHLALMNGVPVEVRTDDGTIRGETVRLIDFDEPDNNDWLAVNQFTVVEQKHERRPDIVLFVNGLALALIELKSAAQESATIWSAFNQLQTYKNEIPSLLAFNELLVISDGLQARLGSLTAEPERFMPWRTIEGQELAPDVMPQIEVLLRGVFEHRRFLDFIRHFVVFEDEGGGKLTKKLAGYHQFHAVNTAIEETVKASHPLGDRRVGVIWHTQGAGKSLTMAFYAGKVILHPAMVNPTIVALTDRNDLDDQLFGTFARCKDLLRQVPVQAENRADLREKLRVASGGVIFTTIQKFFPQTAGDPQTLLSDRRNIVVIADEAHRSQYDFIDGFARHMRDALPNASFVGFTGTPIELEDRNTRAVFGDYISIYDIQQAVEDGATVPIYYESRLAKLALDPEEQPKLDVEFEEITEGEEEEAKQKLRSKWAQLEAVVGAEHRLRLIAEDLVRHFEQRLEAMDGKGMIVGMSRRICVELYQHIVALRPKWHGDDDRAGTIKIVMTGSASDPATWQPHIRTKAAREDLARRFKEASDPFKLVIVRDMWLTGFDAPSLHTMYLDKPMHGHSLMQAIARVNRVFKDKPGGLVVDYLGLAAELKRALATYTESGGRGRTALKQDEAVAVMLEKYEVCRDLFHGFDWSTWVGAAPATKLELLAAAQEHVLKEEDGKYRLLRAVTELSKAFALAVPHEEALKIRDDVAFFQAVRGAMAKWVRTRGGPPGVGIDQAIRQLVSEAIAPEGVIDVFAAAGLKKPDISILSEEFLAEVRGMQHKHLGIELLRRLLTDEIKVRERKHLVQARSFAEMLQRAILGYHNRSIATAEILEELIRLAREVREAERRGEDLGLSDEEAAFYEALEVNDSAVQVLGEPTLKTIARELVQAVRGNVTIDWTIRENVRAKMRVIVKRILRKHGYPPDKQEKATHTVLEQAELLSAEWAPEAA
jgi:type I restriction enzyme, R subunit